MSMFIGRRRRAVMRKRLKIEESVDNWWKRGMNEQRRT